MANETYGAIKLSDANAVGSMLVKKMGGSGYAPKDWADTINLMGKLPEKTVSGSIANFSDGADEVPVKNWLVTLPASLDGYSEVNGAKEKKNIIILSDDNYNSSQKCSYVYENGGVNVSASGTYARVGFLFTLKAGVPFTISFDAIGTGDYNRIYLSETAPFSGQFANISISGTETGYTRTFTLNGNSLYIGVYVTSTGTTGNTIIKNLQLEVGSTATAYEAYEAPTQYTASLGRTIYGGTADVVTGEGVETYGIIRLDSLPLIKNNTQNNPNGTYFSLDGVTVPFVGWGSGGRDSAMSNVLSVGSAGAGGQTEPNNTFWWNNASTGWRIVWGEPNGGSSLTEFMKWLTDNNVVVGGTLQNSTSFTFDPISAPHTSLGTNNLWNDRGDSEVTYRRDIDLALSSGSSFLGFGFGNPNAGDDEIQESEE